ncbi:MAG: transposase, partial [Candidatus Tectomicrobia bacterium]|nr:transposase [Candidatus Tectomicrobia bacterium]
AERASYERKVSERERRKGRHIKAPPEEPDGKQQINLTDADSGLMRRSKQHEYRQAYNAQAVVDVGGSQLVLGVRVSTNASDRRELVADVDAIPEAVGTAKEVLADNGYATGGEVAQLEQRGMEVLVATTAEWRRRHDFRPKAAPRLQREVRADWITAMRKKMAQPQKSARYRLRQQTVEPAFGIVKQAIGFRQFLLRGIKKVEGEWGLVMLAYNCRRLHKLART